MIKKIILLAVIFSLSLALLPAHAIPGYTPHQGDYFNYYDVINLANSTGAWYGYTEHETVNGIERMSQVFVNGTVASNYTYTYNWSNSSGSTQNGNSAGPFTWSSTSFQYVKGNDSQIGYVKPLYVWFYLDNTTQLNGNFRFLNTLMTVTSTSYSYSLASQNRYVKTIRAQGNGGYQRSYGGIFFSAAFSYTTYSDPSTGYIIGYDYVEQDTNPNVSFTWTDTFYVTTTSYPLSAGTGPSFLQQYLGLIVGLVVFLIFIVIIVIVIVAVSRRRRSLPRHTYPQVPIAPPQIDLTPKQQPSVQQVVIKEVVKVKCKYCGALIDSTVQACPFCGAPRT